MGHLRAGCGKCVSVAFCSLLYDVRHGERRKELGRGTGLEPQEKRGVELAGKLLHQFFGRVLARLERLRRKVVALVRKLQSVPANVGNCLFRLEDVAGDLLLLRPLSRILVGNYIPYEQAGYKSDGGDCNADYAKHLACDATLFGFRRNGGTTALFLLFCLLPFLAFAGSLDLEALAALKRDLVPV